MGAPCRNQRISKNFQLANLRSQRKAKYVAGTLVTRACSPCTGGCASDKEADAMMKPFVFIGAIAALVLSGVTAAQAQVYVEEGYVAPPVYVAPSPYVAPTVVAPAPYVAAPATVVAPARRYLRVAPAATVVAPAATVVEPPAYEAYGYAPPAYTAPASGYTVVEYGGRRCTVEPSGYRYCWTP
jgi:hypothetical protein